MLQMLLGISAALQPLAEPTDLLPHQYLYQPICACEQTHINSSHIHSIFSQMLFSINFHQHSRKLFIIPIL